MISNKRNRIIFLDIDGVLNSAQYFKDLYYIFKFPDPPSQPALHDRIDPIAVTRLNRLTDTTGAMIVLSSTWRMGFKGDTEAVATFFKSVGITGEVIGMTPVLTHFRGAEISRWLIENDPTDICKFIILDDSDDMGNIIHKLIRTNLKYGLLDSHVDKAIEMLK
jgi:hypothetical protein